MQTFRALALRQCFWDLLVNSMGLQTHSLEHVYSTKRGELINFQPYTVVSTLFRFLENH